MSEQTTYMLVFSANLAFIVTHIYGWLLKWFYKPKAYGDRFSELFPAQKAVGVIYLLQIFELPYLFQIGDPDALLFVNAFALLFFSLQMLVMCELYFFPRTSHPLKDFWVFIPAVVVLLPLFLQAIGVISLPANHRLWTFIVISVVFLAFFWMSIRMALKIGRAVRQSNEDTYADSDDFPVQFAQYIQWVPTVVCVLLACNFYADDPWVKFVRDIIFICASIAFCIYTLNPWRKGFTKTEEIFDEMGENDANISHRLNNERYNDLATRLDQLLTKEHIFTQPHFTSESLMHRLGTNSNYLSEVIRRSGYQSFYDMINMHRVRHAIALITQNPDERLQNIALLCGFSSSASMSKAFQSQGKPSPSTFKRR
ncbi:MAG: AraC family transcriptional regulator [Muribaculaceae bacterium]|nr:AraC family transcriptional regulator [Muribaculaceae bacterium]